MRGLDGEHVVVGHPVDHPRVGADQRRRLLADAREQGGEVEGLVQRLGRAREGGLLPGHAAVLHARRLVREGGARGRGERAAQLERVRIVHVLLAARQREHAAGLAVQPQQDRVRVRDAVGVRGRPRSLQPHVIRVAAGELRRGVQLRHAHAREGASRARDARVAVVLRQGDDRRGGHAQQLERIAGDRLRERILVALRGEREQPRDEREAVHGGAELSTGDHGGWGSEPTASVAVRTEGSAGADRPLHYPERPGRPGTAERWPSG